MRLTDTHLLRGLLTLAVCVAQAAAGIAQQQISTGTITGRVHDQGGLAVPRATIEAVNEQNGQVRRTESNASGDFNILALPIGRYTLRVSATGFDTVKQVGIQLRSNEAFNAGTITLPVDTVEEQVTVTADSGGVQTATAVKTQVVEAAEIDSMVARGRDPIRALNALPGVLPVLDIDVGGDLIGGVIGTTLPTIQGTAGFASYVAVDGVGSADGDTGRNNGIASLDSIEEVRVVLSNYTAEFGRNTGPQINIVTRSGGQRYGGSLATYFRHEALNSNPVQNVRLGLPKPPARYYSGVGTFGGPAWLPWLGKLERTFFFYTHEQWDTKLPESPNTKLMPTAAERSGDFSRTTQTNGQPFYIRDPLRPGACSATTGGPGCFPGNIIPADRINPLGQGILSLFPAPNFFDASISRFQYNYRDVDQPKVYRALDQLTLDHNFGDGDRVQVKWRRWRPNREATTRTFGINSNWNHFRGQYAQKEDAFTVNHTHVFSKSVVNELAVGYRYTPEVAPVATMPDPISKLQRQPNGLGALGRLYDAPTLNPLDLYPTMSFGGLPGDAPNIAWDARFPIDASDRRWSFQNNLSWTRGRHLFKAGAYWEHNVNSEGFSAPCFSGCLDFTSSGTIAAQNPFNTNHPYANALLGYYTSYSESNVRPFRGGQQWTLEWFGQDSWKVRPNLTLELGMRFTTGKPWHLRKSGWKNWNPAPGLRAAGWLASAYDAARKPRLYVPACPGGAERCGANARLAKNPLTGEVIPNSVALIGQLVPGSGDFYNGLVLDDDPRSYDGAFQPNPGVHAMPRLGFAWAPNRSGRTSIRGGYGVSKQIFDNSGAFANTFPLAPPARLQPTLYYGSLSAIGGVSQFFSPSDVVGHAHDDGQVRTTHHFSLELQQNVGFNTVVTAAYVGNRQRGLPTARNINLVPPGARFAPASVDPTTGGVLPDAFLRPIPQFNQVTERARDGVADYDSLQLTANRRFNGGVGFGVAYTLSKTKDMQGTLTTFLEPRARLYDYADTDRRHILSFNASWDLPNGSSLWSNWLTKALLDGWQLAGIGFVVSGAPAAVTFSTTDAGGTDTLGGGDAVRVNLTCDPKLPRGQRNENRWFDTSCFARPARGEIGNAPRQMIRHPGIQNLDLSLSKSFAAGQARTLLFRAEAYNVLGLTRRTAVTSARFDPQGNQVNAAFGTLGLPTGEARVIQLSLRFRF
jgi:hypothetical protein